MFKSQIKIIKKALAEGRSIFKEQTAVLSGFGDAIYVDGKLAAIVSSDLLVFWESEFKKAKIDINRIPSGPKGTALI